MRLGVRPSGARKKVPKKQKLSCWLISFSFVFDPFSVSGLPGRYVGVPRPVASRVQCVQHEKSSTVSGRCPSHDHDHGVGLLLFFDP